MSDMGVTFAWDAKASTDKAKKADSLIVFKFKLTKIRKKIDNVKFQPENSLALIWTGGGDLSGKGVHVLAVLSREGGH